MPCLLDVARTGVRVCSRLHDGLVRMDCCVVWANLMKWFTRLWGSHHRTSQLRLASHCSGNRHLYEGEPCEGTSSPQRW